jgi:hypothetical protein
VFPSIKSYEVALALDKFIKEVKAKNEKPTQADTSTGMKTRKNVRDNFACSLLLGIMESKEREEGYKIHGVMNESEDA